MSEPQKTTAHDYYQEFGFKQKEPTDQLRQDVERVRRQWRLLASLSGDKGAGKRETPPPSRRRSRLPRRCVA